MRLFDLESGFARKFKNDYFDIRSCISLLVKIWDWFQWKSKQYWSMIQWLWYNSKQAYVMKNVNFHCNIHVIPETLLRWTIEVEEKAVSILWNVLRNEVLRKTKRRRGRKPFWWTCSLMNCGRTYVLLMGSGLMLTEYGYWP